MGFLEIRKPDLKLSKTFYFNKIRSNLCITTTWGTKFLLSLETGGHYEEDLCIMTKTANSDIWSLYKGSMIFHLITHDTVKNKSVCIFVRNKKQCWDKTTYYK